MARRTSTGFTVVELLVVVSIIGLLFGILLPAIGKARDNASVNTSKNNLRQIGIAHMTYAADWADRHVTYTRDNLGQYGGDVGVYCAAIYGDGGGMLEVHPPIVLGWGYELGGRYKLWAYRADCGDPVWAFQPINFPGPPDDLLLTDGWGWYRFGIQAKTMNEYLNGRYHDPLFFAPKDRVILDPVEPCFDVPGEFVAGEPLGGLGPGECFPAWGSYCLSPAGLFDPNAFADNGDGKFWTAPWEMPAGYRVPSFGQVRYPTLKTHILEHHWLQNTKARCNESFLGCEPYYFNHSFRSSPVTLFYDGSVRLMSVFEAMSSDRRHVRQTGHGLWSRDTPFGTDGFFIGDGYDFAETSYHILTIDGVRGRDTIGSE